MESYIEIYELTRNTRPDFNPSKKNAWSFITYHSSFENIQTGVAVNPFNSTQHSVISTVDSSNAYYSIHLFSKLPPLEKRKKKKRPISL